MMEIPGLGYWMELDEGRGAGYSCITSIDNDHIGILYEGSQAHMTFQKININELIKNMIRQVVLNVTKNFKVWGFIFTIIFCFIYSKTNAQDKYFEYTNLPDLPPNIEQNVQPGLAGPYAGIDDDVLIVAGGANFPDKLPWEGGRKTYHDEIFILKKKADGTVQWEVASTKIPFAAGYGGAISTNNGLFCFGGNTSSSNISNTWFIDYIPETGEIEISQGPDLPRPLTNFAFSKVDNSIYVAGGISDFSGESTNSFYKLSLVVDSPKDWKWELLPSWDGDPRAFSVGAGQSNGLENCFYLFSGRNISANGDWDVLLMPMFLIQLPIIGKLFQMERIKNLRSWRAPLFHLVRVR